MAVRQQHSGLLILRLEGVYYGELMRRFGKLARFVIGQAEIKQHTGIAGIIFNRAPVLGDCLFVMACPSQRCAQVRPDFESSRPDLQVSPVLSNGAFQVAGLVQRQGLLENAIGWLLRLRQTKQQQWNQKAVHRG